jgi:predicted ester cyclase
MIVEGTHQGVFLSVPPTGKQGTGHIITIYRIADGKMAEVWCEADQLGMMQQLGLVLPPQAAR